MKIIVLSVLYFFTVVDFTYTQEEDDIAIDRLGVTVTPVTVPANFIQAELGGNYWIKKTKWDYIEGSVFTKRKDYRTYVTNPSFSVRYGILKNFELNLAIAFRQEYINYAYWSTVLSYERTSTIYGWGMLQAGTKINFFGGKKIIPASAFILNLSIPLGNYYFHTDKVSPEFKLAFNNVISKNFALNYNLGYGWYIYDNFTDSYGTYAVSISYKLTKRLDAFAETYGTLEDGRTPDMRGGAGFSYLFAKNVMADFSAGIGFSKRSPDFSLGMGISLRLPG